MTTIEFGGGPTLEQRREFASVKDGTQKPGYTGYCPQVKYNPGRTYGQQTYECSKEFPFVAPAPENKTPVKFDLPESNGDNKYMQDMKPGYSGYIPRLLFKFGGTYKNDCDVALDEHFTNHRKKKISDKKLQDVLVSFPRMQSLNFDPEIKDHLNTYRDCQCLSPVLTSPKRPLLEPAICGYTGFIPRMFTTHAGLGVRYHQKNVNGLKMFDHENKTHFQILKLPITVQQCPSSVPPEEHPPHSRRVYMKSGMTPNYTGYIPFFKFDYGRTYGDLTRSLEECQHDLDCYGDFMAVKVNQGTQIVS